MWQMSITPATYSKAKVLNAVIIWRSSMLRKEKYKQGQRLIRERLWRHTFNLLWILERPGKGWVNAPGNGFFHLESATAHHFHTHHYTLFPRAFWWLYLKLKVKEPLLQLTQTTAVMNKSYCNPRSKTICLWVIPVLQFEFRINVIRWILM